MAPRPDFPRVIERKERAIRRSSVPVSLLVLVLVRLVASRAIRTDDQEASSEATSTTIPPVLLAWLEPVMDL